MLRLLVKPKKVIRDKDVHVPLFKMLLWTVVIVDDSGGWNVKHDIAEMILEIVYYGIVNKKDDVK